MAAIVAATGCTSPSGGSQYVPAPLGGPGLGKGAMPRDAHHPGRRPRAHDRASVRALRAARRYNVQRLVAAHGADAKLTELLVTLANCAQSGAVRAPVRSGGS
jgi:hypothetical protein